MNNRIFCFLFFILLIKNVGNAEDISSINFKPIFLKGLYCEFAITNYTDIYHEKSNGTSYYSSVSDYIYYDGTPIGPNHYSETPYFSDMYVYKNYYPFQLILKYEFIRNNTRINFSLLDRLLSDIIIVYGPDMYERDTTFPINRYETTINIEICNIKKNILYGISTGIKSLNDKINTEITDEWSYVEWLRYSTYSKEINSLSLEHNLLSFDIFLKYFPENNIAFGFIINSINSNINISNTDIYEYEQYNRIPEPYSYEHEIRTKTYSATLANINYANYIINIEYINKKNNSHIISIIMNEQITFL